MDKVLKIYQTAFVDFETAMLAKELGFDYACNNYYQISLTERYNEQDGYSGSFGWEKGELSRSSGFFMNNNPDTDYTNESWFLCACPTQQVLCRWLREEKNIHVSVHPASPKRYYYSISVITDNGLVQIVNRQGDPQYVSKTFEEALEKAIIGSLDKLKKDL